MSKKWQNMSNVPKLRFKDFSGEWEESKLKEYCFNISSGKSKNIEGGEYYLYGSTGIIGNTDKFTHNGTYILIARVGANAGLTNLIKGKFGVTDNTLILDLDKEKSNISFILSLLHKYNLNRLIFGSGQPLITGGQLKSLKLYFPQKQEQEKIASFLNQVDTKIEQLTKKEKLLQQYKKGVMQKIFNQEIRFVSDDGSEFCEWEEKNGNEIFETISNKNHNSDLPILAISQEFGAIPRDMIDYKITVTEKSVSSYKVVSIGDFIISLRSFQGGIEYSSYKGICSPAYIILRPFIEINNDFFRLYFKMDRYIQQLNSKLEGIRDGKMISYKYFSEIKLPFPCIEEQTKIANFLSSIDTKIEQTQKQLEKTKEFKKALLQQMFV